MRVLRLAKESAVKARTQALNQLKAVPPAMVPADVGYGDTVAFRLGLNPRGLRHVVGISITLTAHQAAASPVTPSYNGIGRRPVARYPDPALSVQAPAIEAGRGSAKPVFWCEGSHPGKGRTGLKRMYARFVALRIRPAGR